jgi:hypothetical protein
VLEELSLRMEQFKRPTGFRIAQHLLGPDGLSEGQRQLAAAASPSILSQAMAIVAQRRATPATAC